MAIAAIDPVAGDMPLVAELNRLLTRDANAGDPRRSVHRVRQAEQARHDEGRAENTDARDRVGAAMKYLRHLVLLTAYVTRRPRKPRRGPNQANMTPTGNRTNLPQGVAEPRDPIL